jgi:hypothetical protein
LHGGRAWLIGLDKHAPDNVGNSVQFMGYPTDKEIKSLNHV